MMALPGWELNVFAEVLPLFFHYFKRYFAVTADGARRVRQGTPVIFPLF